MVDPLAVHSFVNSWKKKDYVRGESDCAIMVADWILLNTGKDGAAPLRGSYDNAKEALRGLLRCGVKQPADLVDTVINRTDNPPRLGDVCEVITGDKIIPIGICRGGKSGAWVMSPTGIEVVSFAYISKVWSIDGH